MSTTVRSFIAMDLPGAVVCRLEDAQQGLKALKLPAKWVRPENIHLTLKFLGNVSAGRIDEIASAMARAAVDQAALALALRGVGFFPGIKRPRVVWIGLDGQVQRLFALQRTVEEQLAAIGFAKEKRPFKGHLTLGRIRQSVHPHVMRRIMDDYSNFAGDQFIAGRICLFQSDLQPSGAVYSRLKKVDLIPGAEG